MTAYARTSDLSTSHEAASQVRTGWCEALVADALYTARNRPVTHRELVLRVRGLCVERGIPSKAFPTDQSIRSRCAELVRRGVVEPAGSVQGEKRREMQWRLTRSAIRERDAR